MRRLVLLGILLVGCTKPEDETGTLIPDTDDDTDVEGCAGPNAPTAALTISPGGMSEGDVCGDGSKPLILFEIEAEDVDGDLDFYEIEMWWDETVDGVVSTSDAPNSEVTGAIGEECRSFVGTIGLRQCVTGNPPYSTEMEFGLRILDHAGNKSDLVIQTFTTPDASGNY